MSSFHESDYLCSTNHKNVLPSSSMLDDSPLFRMIELDETVSTNNFLQGYHPLQPVEITLVTAEYQTAGRGQQGNSWESARGENLLFSLLVFPTTLPATQLFVLSEAIALSIKDTIKHFLDESGQNADGREVTVKWPNDIYVDDRKIAGILIENDLQGGHICRAILGCGVNVNQEAFASDAPNPVSLRQLLGHETERSFVLNAIVENFARRYADIQKGCYEDIHQDYLSSLYRREGIYPFHDSKGPFMAEIADVEPTGYLILRETDNSLRRYAFKEVSYS